MTNRQHSVIIQMHEKLMTTLRDLSPLTKVKKCFLHNPMLLTLQLRHLHPCYPTLKSEFNLSTDAGKQAARGNVSAHVHAFAFALQLNVQCLVVTLKKKG